MSRIDRFAELQADYADGYEQAKLIKTLARWFLILSVVLSVLLVVGGLQIPAAVGTLIAGFLGALTMRGAASLLRAQLDTAAATRALLTEGLSTRPAASGEPEERFFTQSS